MLKPLTFQNFAFVSASFRSDGRNHLQVNAFPLVAFRFEERLHLRNGFEGLELEGGHGYS